MGRTGRPVYKHNSNGRLTAEYQSVKEASEAEGMQPGTIYKAIECGDPIKGFRFSWNRDAALPSNDIPLPDGLELWERNGMFDVDKYSNAQLY